ncbi:MAG: heme exporter protein CcmB [Firmicutes bacterium]|nr:heme exporter protein CcmB [Bacillota bacterium]
MSYGRAVAAIIRKDFQLEWRTGEALLTPVLLSLLLMLVFVFALPPSALRSSDMFVAGLWTAVFFSGTVGLSRGFGRERPDGRLLGLLLAPVDRGAVFLAKALVSFLFMAISASATIPAFFAVFGQSPGAPVWRWAAVVGLVLLAYSGSGTLLGAVAAQLRAGEVLYPVLLFPLLVPVVLAAVHLTDALLVEGGWGSAGVWMNMLVVYNILFWGVPYLVFEYVVEV